MAEIRGEVTVDFVRRALMDGGDDERRETNDRAELRHGQIRRCHHRHQYGLSDQRRSVAIERRFLSRLDINAGAGIDHALATVIYNAVDERSAIVVYIERGPLTEGTVRRAAGRLLLGIKLYNLRRPVRIGNR